MKIKGQSIDRATLVGISVALGLVVGAISLGGSLSTFFDLESVLIVLGGTFGATLVSFPAGEVGRSIALLKNVLYESQVDVEGRVEQILQIARKARAHGKLSLEGDLQYELDPFMRKCMELVVDDLPIEDLRKILEIELSFQEDFYRTGAQVFQTMGTVAPAMGLVGTLIGLVQMLRDLQHPELIGPAMATALLTTFYGALISYLLCLPIAAKLRLRSTEESLLKELTLEGILCIHKGVNPRMVEQHVMGFLAPGRRRTNF